jgi:trans-aconitate 2-methyltransferase
LKDRNKWDAKTYHRISTIQEKWGRDVLERKKWNGNEIVMDAGCGSGRVTKRLVEKVGKGGFVYAVDIDTNMINQAKEYLSSFKNVLVIESDLLNVELPRRVDVIFSNAVLHWILDHKRLFKQFWKLLSEESNNENKKMKGTGILLAQCGGCGNLGKVHSLMNQIRGLSEFEAYFVNWKEPWYFAKPEDTEKLLKQIGFKNIKVYLSDGTTTFTNRTSYSSFVETAIIKPFLEYLPNEQIKRSFLKTFLDNIEQSRLAWTLDYVRLNIVAQK